MLPENGTRCGICPGVLQSVCLGMNTVCWPICRIHQDIVRYHNRYVIVKRPSSLNLVHSLVRISIFVCKMFPYCAFVIELWWWTKALQGLTVCVCLGKDDIFYSFLKNR